SLDDVESERTRVGKHSVRRSVSGDHDGFRRDGCNVIRGGDSLAGQLRNNRCVVHEVAEDGRRSGLRLIERQLDGITDAKTHAEMLGPKDTHVHLEVISTDVYFVSQSQFTGKLPFESAISPHFRQTLEHETAEPSNLDRRRRNSKSMDQRSPKKRNGDR